MPPARPRGKRTHRARTLRLNVTEPREARQSKAIRGMKLKTASTLTLMFALLCLAALIAGKGAGDRSSGGPEVYANEFACQNGITPEQIRRLASAGVCRPQAPERPCPRKSR
jgi:hypothetical protein